MWWDVSGNSSSRLTFCSTYLKKTFCTSAPSGCYWISSNSSLIQRFLFMEAEGGWVGGWLGSGLLSWFGTHLTSWLISMDVSRRIDWVLIDFRFLLRRVSRKERWHMKEGSELPADSRMSLPDSRRMDTGLFRFFPPPHTESQSITNRTIADPQRPESRSATMWNHQL